MDDSRGESFLGLRVSVTLQDGTAVVGTVGAVDPSRQALTLHDVSKNGKKLKVRKIELEASEVHDITRVAADDDLVVSPTALVQQTIPAQQPPEIAGGARINTSELFSFPSAGTPAQPPPMVPQALPFSGAWPPPLPFHQPAVMPHLPGPAAPPAMVPNFTASCVYGGPPQPQLPLMGPFPAAPPMPPHQVPGYWLPSSPKTKGLNTVPISSPNSERAPSVKGGTPIKLLSRAGNQAKGQQQSSSATSQSSGGSQSRTHANSSQGQAPRSGRKGNSRMSRRKEDSCLYGPLDGSIKEDFDFEGNLNKFEKAQVFAEIEEQFKDMDPQQLLAAHNRRVDHTPNRGSSAPVGNAQSSNHMYAGHSSPGSHCQVKSEFGIDIPCVNALEMQGVYAMAENMGISRMQLVENAAHGVCAMVLRLLGGSRRINPRNTNQAPAVVVLAGSGLKGASAIGLARHLACHNIDVTLCAVGPAEQWSEVSELVTNQLKLYLYTGGRLVKSSRELQLANVEPVDVIVDGLIDLNTGEVSFQAVGDLISWTTDSGANILSLDFPSGVDCTTGAVQGGRQVMPKWTVTYGLPKTGLKAITGAKYLADIGIPAMVYTRAGIKYTPPFGDKYVVPITFDGIGM